MVQVTGCISLVSVSILSELINSVWFKKVSHSLGTLTVHTPRQEHEPHLHYDDSKRRSLYWIKAQRSNQFGYQHVKDFEQGPVYSIVHGFRSYYVLVSRELSMCHQIFVQASEVVHDASRRHSKTVVFKLDFEKAY